jgi:HlyD family secretion protein
MPDGGVYRGAILIDAGPQRKRWVKPLVIVAILVAGMVLLRLTVFQPAPVPVTVYRVDTGRVEDTVVNSRAGMVQSRRRAGMSPAIPGLVTRIAVEKGTRVRQGEILLQLDDIEHRAQVELAARSLDAARASADQARMEAEQAERLSKRTKSLAEAAVVSETVLDLEVTRALTTQAASVAAQARVREAEAALEVARATLSKTTMTAPFDGVVLDVTTEVGEWISPAPPGVFIPRVIDLIDPAALYVSAPIDEADVARLRLGLPVRITLDAFREKSFAGTLTYISSFVETREDQNRTLRVEAVFEETSLPANLFPGLSADLEIILDSRPDVLRIPSYALLEGDKVFLLEDGVLVERVVTTGLRNWGFTEIRSGLATNQPVVVSLDRPEVVVGARVEIAGEVKP